jgi:copper homeostasis protein
MTRDPLRALEALVDLGVDRVLTSGQEATILEGLPLLANLFEVADDRIVVMPGGGIMSRNIGRIVDALKPNEILFRGAAIGSEPDAFPPSARLHGRGASAARVRSG